MVVSLVTFGVFIAMGLESEIVEDGGIVAAPISCWARNDDEGVISVFWISGVGVFDVVDDSLQLLGLVLK